MTKIKYLFFAIFCLMTFIPTSTATSTLYKHIKTEEDILVIDAIENEDNYILLSEIPNNIFIYDKEGNIKNKIEYDEDFLNRTLSIKINGANYLITKTYNKENNPKSYISVGKLNDDGTLSEETELEVNAYYGLPVNVTSYTDLITIQEDEYVYVYYFGDKFLKIMNDLSSAEVVEFDNLPEEDKHYGEEITNAQENGSILEQYDGGYITYNYNENRITYFKNNQEIWSLSDQQLVNCKDITSYKDQIILLTKSKLIPRPTNPSEKYNEHRLITVDGKEGIIIENENISSYYDSLNVPYGERYNASQYYMLDIENGFLLVTEWQTDSKNSQPDFGSYMMYFLAKDSPINPKQEEPKEEEQNKEEITQDKEVTSSDNGPETSDNVIIYSIVLIISILTFVLAVYKKPSL